MFRSGMPVQGHEFVNRRKELRLLTAYLRDGQHVMLKAPRRFGKTSLVIQAFSRIDGIKLYLDLQRTPDLNRLAHLIIEDIYAQIGFSGFLRKMRDSVITLLRDLQVSAHVDMAIAQVTIEKLEKTQDATELFLYALDLVNTVAKQQNVNIKLAMDEFQDIQKFDDPDILSKLCSVIQHHQHVTYVFLGSLESLMTAIFQKKTSPFFHFARAMELDGLEIGDLLTHALDTFRGRKLHVDEQALLDALELLEGHPYYCAKTLRSVNYMNLENGKPRIERSDIRNAILHALCETKSYLEEILGRLKSKKHHYEVLYSIANNTKPRIDSKNLYRIHKSLEEMGFLKNVEIGVYKITDVFLRFLLLQKSDASLVFHEDILLPY